MAGRIMRKLLAPKRKALECSDERGVTTIEMALVLPIVLIFVMGIIELGNMYRIMLTMQKASQFGTRMAVTGMGYEDGSRMSYILGETNRLLDNLPGDPPEVTVQSWPGIDPSGAGREGNPGQPCEMVEVKVDYKYKPITPLAGLLAWFGGTFPDKIPLSQSSSKINEPWIPCD